jgi:hypothetical protein
MLFELTAISPGVTFLLAVWLAWVSFLFCFLKRLIRQPSVAASPSSPRGLKGLPSKDQDLLR